MTTYFQIVAPKFTAGGEMAQVFNEYGRKNRCAYSAPIIGYMNGWDERQLRSYCLSRGWNLKFYEGE